MSYRILEYRVKCEDLNISKGTVTDISWVGFEEASSIFNRDCSLFFHSKITKGPANDRSDIKKTTNA